MSDPTPPLRLVPAERQPWPALVEHLEEMLKSAKAGELRSFGCVFEELDGTMSRWAFHGEGSYPVKMVGELEVLKLAVMHRHCKFEDE